MHIEINGKEVGLKVSMWMLDEDRIGKMLNEKPDSTIWKFVSYFFIAHKNFCRYNKIEPVVTIEDMDLYVDEQISTTEGRNKLKVVFDDLVAQANAMSDNSSEKKIIVTEQVSEPIGQQ